jgi:hypothetical protein
MAAKNGKDHYGKNDDDVLAVRGTTMQFNPSFDSRIIDKALEEDPQRYGAEYFFEWRDDLCSFIDRVLLDAAVDTGVVVRPQMSLRRTPWASHRSRAAISS